MGFFLPYINIIYQNKTKALRKSSRLFLRRGKIYLLCTSCKGIQFGSVYSTIKENLFLECCKLPAFYMVVKI